MKQISVKSLIIESLLLLMQAFLYIDRFVLIYKDGTADEVKKSAFTTKDNYFMILGKSDKLLKEIKVYDKKSIDITDEYNKL